MVLIENIHIINNKLEVNYNNNKLSLRQINKLSIYNN
jgi:hypothetical protein